MDESVKMNLQDISAGISGWSWPLTRNGTTLEPLPWVQATKGQWKNKEFGMYLNRQGFGAQLQHVNSTRPTGALTVNGVDRQFFDGELEYFPRKVLDERTHFAWGIDLDGVTVDGKFFDTKGNGAVLDSGTYGDMGFLEPITVGESAQNGCLSGGSYGTTSASGPVQTGGGSSGELRGTGGNGNPPGGHGSGTGGGKGGQAGKSNTGTIVGAVVGSVVGAALILGVLIWWLLRRRRAVRTNYAVDLHDESDVPGTGTMTNAMITPLTFRHDSSQTTASMDEKGRLINGSLSSPASHSHSQNFSAPGSQGYTSQQLSGTHEGTASGSAGPSEFGSGPQNEPEIDAEAPFRQAGAQPPPSYDHVLWVTRPDGARRLRPRQNPDAPAGAPGAGAGGAAVVGEEKAPTTGLSLVQQ